MLEQKIEKAIDFIKRAEKLALKMNPENGFWLAFSGGKDSVVIHTLAELANVKFTAYYNLTTIDPPEVVRFIIESYPNVVRLRPKMTFLQLVEKKVFLPTRGRRSCCDYLKESTGGGNVVITGVRAAESITRAKNASDVKIRRSKKTSAKSFSEMEQTEFSCVHGRDKISIFPIIDWTSKDVWDFIAKYNLPYCKLYDCGWSRLGCLFCPNAKKSERAMHRRLYPKFLENIKKRLQKREDKVKEIGFEDAQDMIDWWFSDDSIEVYLSEKKQLSLFN